MDQRREIRASHADRKTAVDRLKSDMDTGRLDVFEYDRRLGLAYQAVTMGDLDELFADLPPAQPGTPVAWTPPPVATRAAGVFGDMPMALKVLWTVWGSILLINVTVWLLVSLGAGEPVYFWPMWLLVPGVCLGGATAGVQAIRRSQASQPRSAVPAAPPAPPAMPAGPDQRTA